MNLKPCIIVSLLVTGTAIAWAQQPRRATPSSPPPQNRPAAFQLRLQELAQAQGAMMEENFFPPELVMQNQNAIGLTADQQTAIRAEMQKVMPQFTDLQWQQSAEAERMASLLRQDRPDEKEVLAQLDKLLNIENETKRLHTGLLVRIKNTLTPDQQAQLRQIKQNALWRPLATPPARRGLNPPSPPPQN